jgi:hypothetical protein
MASGQCANRSSVLGNIFRGRRKSDNNAGQQVLVSSLSAWVFEEPAVGWQHDNAIHETRTAGYVIHPSAFVRNGGQLPQLWNSGYEMIKPTQLTLKYSFCEEQMPKERTNTESRKEI